ncbi:MAG: hypothetical protein RL223_539 [Pseudomonadota bacterium]|jgi:hypothetical protein
MHHHTNPDINTITLRWLAHANVTQGKALHLALLLISRCAESGQPCLLLTRRMLAAGHVSRDAAYGALRSLQELGMVNVRRLPGRSPQVALLEPGTDRHLRMPQAVTGTTRAVR